LVEEGNSAIEKLKKLPPGAYGVGLHNHRIGYIKMDDQLGFIWDPNKGAIALVGKKQADELLKYLLKYNRYATASSVYFEKAELNIPIQ
jgi:hypothetical protein